MTDLQNKICAFNIEMNGRTITTVPVLFRIHENGSKDVNDILEDHMNEILETVYKNAVAVDDLSAIKISGIAYDIMSENDEFETFTVDVSKYVSYDNEYLHNLILDKIMKYSKFVLDKMGVSEVPADFVDAFRIINEHNTNKINVETFIQYILSCFYNDYGNNIKLETEIHNIMNNKLNN